MIPRHAERQPPRNRGQDDDDIAVGRGRLEPSGEAYVLVVDVNIDEPSQALLLDESLLDTGMTGLDIVDHLKQGGAVAVDGLAPPVKVRRIVGILTSIDMGSFFSFREFTSRSTCRA